MEIAFVKYALNTVINVMALLSNNAHNVMKIIIYYKVHVTNHVL